MVECIQVGFVEYDWGRSLNEACESLNLVTTVAIVGPDTNEGPMETMPGFRTLETRI
jgi:hypothetical protein